MFHDAEGFAGVAVDDHRHIAVASAQAGLVDEEDPAAAPTPLRRYPIRPRPGQAHDEMPRQPVAAGHLPDRHDVDIADQAGVPDAGSHGFSGPT